MTKNLRNQLAVSSVVGALLMLGLSVTLFGVLYIGTPQIVDSMFPGVERQLSDVYGCIDGNTVILEHMGGNDIEEYKILVDGTEIYKGHNWIIGERQQFDITETSDIIVISDKGLVFTGKFVPFEYIVTEPPIPPSDTIYVDDDFDVSTDGWQTTHFDKIQDGINAVTNETTVFVYTGVYNENVVVDTTINLTGEDKNNTIIDASGSGDVVYVSADSVNITNFYIQNSGSIGYPAYESGIQILSQHNIISDCIIVDNSRGVWIRNNNNTISSCSITSSMNQGIEIYNSRDNIVSNNDVSFNGGAGIKSDHGSYNSIENNVVLFNDWHGVVLDDSSNNNAITGNYVESNTEIGIVFYDAVNNLITDNHVALNDIGINTGSSGNTIYHNNFVDNNQNAYDVHSNIWNDTSTGNYWSDYIGVDIDNNGIGDTPYYIPTKDSYDYFPLMNQV